MWRGSINFFYPFGNNYVEVYSFHKMLHYFVVATCCCCRRINTFLIRKGKV